MTRLSVTDCRPSALLAALLLLMAAPANAALSEAQRLAAVYDNILSARFDQIDAQLAYAREGTYGTASSLGEAVASIRYGGTDRRFSLVADSARSEQPTRRRAIQ